MKRLFVLPIILLLCCCMQKEEVSITQPHHPGISITDLIEPYTAPLSSSTLPYPTTPTTIPHQPVTEVIHSGWAVSAPEIDGIISPTEWSNASIIVLSGFDRLYVMNNQSHVFFLYVILDRNRFYKDSALFLDPNSDGRYNYVYGDRRVFMVFPLFGGVVGDGGGIYCGNSIIGVDDTLCGESFDYVVSEGKNAYYRSSSSITSEASIPIDSEESVFFWLLYGYPSNLCFPGSMQCHSNPVFAELVLAEPADKGKTYLHDDHIGPLDYYDIKPTT